MTSPTPSTPPHRRHARADAKALVGGKAANLGVMARDLGLPGAARLRHHDRDLPDASWRAAGRPASTTSCASRMAERRGGRRPPLRRPGGPAARERPVRGARLDARDDGHDPEPRPRTTRRPPAWPGPPATRRSPRRCRERFEASFRSIVGVDEVPSDPWLQLRAGDRGRVPVVEQRPGAGLSREGGHPRRPRDRGDRPGDGLRQPRRRPRRPACSSRATPRPARPTLYGDVMFDAQGEDVVAGTHATEPIAVLDERLPAVAAELRDHAARLERHYADLCDIEFTIEDGPALDAPGPGRQAQPAGGAPDRRRHGRGRRRSRSSRARGGRARRGRCSPHPPTTTSARSSLLLPLATGLPASPGMASGPIATSPEAAQAAAEAGRPAILVRAETSPDDVHGMAAGGRHPDVARRPRQPRRGRGPRLGDPGGGRGGRRSTCATAGSSSATGSLAAGDVITIDGSTARSSRASIPGTTEVVPEARTLLAWADGARASRSATPRRVGADAEPPTPRPPRRTGAQGRRPTTACAPSRSRASRRSQGVADAVLVDAGRRPADPRPARDRRAGRDHGRRLPADRGRHGAGGRAARGRAGGVGARRGRPPRSTPSSTSTTG